MNITSRCEAAHRETQAPDAVARRLDLMAGIELQHGHHHAAERLAWQAAERRSRVEATQA